MVNWWLDKGLAGFRIDAIINIKKNLDFPMLELDGIDGLCFSVPKILGSKEGVSEMLGELKRETFDKHGAFTVGEVFNITDDDLTDFIGENGYFSTIFDFSTELLSAGEHGWYDAPDVASCMEKRLSSMPRTRLTDAALNPISLRITTSLEVLQDTFLFMPEMQQAPKCLAP